jgi:hypothetical protein
VKEKAKQNKGRDCRLNATVTAEERAALDSLAERSGLSVSTVIGKLALFVLAARENGGGVVL